MESVLAVPRLETRKPLREEVYQVLRKAIIEGKLRGGARLVETEIAQQLGISRTPVREAIHMLESEGMVSSIPRKGYVVADFSAQEVEEIFGVRQVLEGYAGRLATSRISVTQLDELKVIYARSLKCVDEQDSASQLFQLNTEFHDLLISCSQNRRLRELIDTVRSSLLSYRLATLTDPAERRHSVEGHKLILAALERRDADAVEDLIKRHVAHSMNVVLQKEFQKELEHKKRRVV